MKMSNDPNTCIRQTRDKEQICRCKQHLKKILVPVDEMAKILAIAGNVVRLKILLLLKEEQRLCVCDLGEILEMKTPAISQHLRKMKDAGVVCAEREGTAIYYQISERAGAALENIFNKIYEPTSSQ